MILLDANILIRAVLGRHVRQLIGAEIKKENVTPSGTPVVTKPMKSGTAEHEQKGVTTPSRAAITLPADSRLPAKIARVRSGVKNDRTMPTPNTTSVSSISTLGSSKRKNRQQSQGGWRGSARGPMKSATRQPVEARGKSTTMLLHSSQPPPASTRCLLEIDEQLRLLSSVA